MYVKQESSEKFTRISDVLPEITERSDNRYPYYDEIAAFTVNGKNRVIVFRRESDTSVTISTYDPENFSTPVASKTHEIPNGHDGGIDILGNNIIFAEANVIYEMNPETCEIVNTYQYSDYVGSEADVIVHDGLIFVSEFILGNDDPTFKLEILSAVNKDKVTGSINGLTVDLASSGNNLYCSGGGDGIYLMKYNDFKNLTLNESDENFSKYTTLAINGEVAAFCSDGNGGLYYILREDFITTEGGRSFVIGKKIYHYDGSKSTQVYSSDTQLGSLVYDPVDKALFAGLYPDVDTPSLMGFYFALTQNSNGAFERREPDFRPYWEDGFYPLLAVVSKTSSSSEQQANTENNTQQTGTETKTLSENIASKLGVSSSDLTLLPSSTTNQDIVATDAAKAAISNDAGFAVIDQFGSVSIQTAGAYYWELKVESNSGYLGQPAANYKIYLVNINVYTGAVRVSSLPSGITETTVTDSSGNSLTTIPSSIYVSANLEPGTHGVYLARSTSSSTGNSNLKSSGAGCNFGFGILPAILIFSCAILRKKF